jgi:hypothetical protein
VTHTRVNHARTAANLRANPGQWMPIGEYRNRLSADGIAAMIRTGQWTSGKWYQPAGAYEAHTRLTDDGTLVEARYTGNPADTAWADAVTSLGGAS